MRGIIYPAVLMIVMAVAPWLHGQDQKAELNKELGGHFTLTKTTADKTDIVKPGSVLVLHKDGLLLCSIDAMVAPTNSYKNGAISFGFGARISWGMALGAEQQGRQTADVPQRKFVTGEKVWITNYTEQNDGVVLQLYSDPYSDVRYHGQLKFPFPKGGAPTADEMMKTIAEVVTVDGATEDTPSPASVAASVPAPTAPASPPPAESSMAPIAPPPPPVDAPPPPPKTITLGQTEDQVVGIFGQPQKVVKLGAKEIYYYSDMKVTFVKGQVTDVQ
jgi:hypothetical protein